MEKEPDSTLAWDGLRKLFYAIRNGNPEVNVPQYNGALFEFDESLDSLEIKNKHPIAALRDLTEIEGKGIDYQNFGVRQLGSLYEALLDYTVKQAEKDLVAVKDEILDFTFASDLKTKPSRVIEKGDLYLSVGGLARKGTGSYYTPEKIVKFLVQKGLEPIFRDRERKFVNAIEKWRKTNVKSDAILSTKYLLDIQMVDPAMGSGHFLVVAVDEITKWIMSLLQRYPDAPLAEEIGKDRTKILSEQNKLGIKLDEELLTFNVILKRKVMKRCVFGVDVNPLAVELAKLSLWLDSFTIGTPLTFLDHHFRCGDSLIGLWIESLKTTKAGNLSLDFWTDNVESMGSLLYQISVPADLTLADFKRNKESYAEFREKSEPLKILLDMRVAASMDKKLQENLPKNLFLVEEIIKQNKLKQEPWSKSILKSISYSERYHFFHWELEFPDAYTDERKGFDLVVMNPPWSAVRLYDDDFFEEYDSKFRRVSTKQEKNKLKAKLMNKKLIAARFNDYMESIQQKLFFFKESGEYAQRAAGGMAFDYWALFLERALTILSTEGTLSVLLPFGIVGNEGATHLRKSLLKNHIRYFYEFENANGIFPDIDRRYKFVLLVVDNGASEKEFNAAFYLHDVAALDSKIESTKFVRMSKEFIDLTSPLSYSAPEIRRQEELTICTKLYKKHPLLFQGIGNYWKFTIMRELNLQFLDSCY
jgi:hypothetical protein